MQKLIETVLDRIFIELEASGRHVHLTKAQSHALFGHSLTEKRPLSQPGQFLAKERVTLIGPKGQLENVAVLGPERKEAQVEISLTDGRLLGVQPPIRLSGSVSGTPGITVVGPMCQLQLRQGLIAAKRHIHLTPEKAMLLGVEDKQVVRLQTFTDRPLIFHDVVVRVSPEFADYVHLDYDEANACGWKNGDLGRILL